MAGCIAVAAVLARPDAAFAHALAERYELPVPLGYFLAAAGLVVALSFAMLTRSAGAPSGRRRYPTLDLKATILGRRASAVFYRALQGIGLAAFLLVVAACLFGNQHGLKNIAPVLVWVIWWVGLAFFCALLGNVWPTLNPWRTLFGVVETLFRSRGGRPVPRSYPDRLGAWPAVALFLVFAWMELVWAGAERPRALAVAILAYSALTWAGMAAYGTEAWLRHADPFSVFFGILGRFAPVSGGDGDPDPPGTVRPYAVALTPDRPLSVSGSAFVMLMLAVVTFDGFRETPLWTDFAEELLHASLLAPSWRVLASAGIDPDQCLLTLALLLAPVLFLGAYGAACWIAARLLAGEGGEVWGRVGTFARLFALTLVPIAIAYHFAHYLSYLLLAGQFAIPLASDPFGLGWNLFGTALYRIDIGVIDARTVWIVCLAAIVLGHVAAIYLAHRTAILRFGTGRRALASQVPLAVLMVGYTMTSLWILAQPIVLSPRPS
ncbi:MAG: hypothetical protein L0210_08320 [Rhodospirillales bacterium]|nr:hypothetical protein [Rhodospirillales bacterium]